MLAQVVSSLIFSISKGVHSAEEETVPKRNVLQRVRRVEAEEILRLAQLIDFKVLRPASVISFP